MPPDKPRSYPSTWLRHDPSPGVRGSILPTWNVSEREWQHPDFRVVHCRSCHEDIEFGETCYDVFYSYELFDGIPVRDEAELPDSAKCCCCDQSWLQEWAVTGKCPYVEVPE